MMMRRGVGGWRMATGALFLIAVAGHFALGRGPSHLTEDADRGFGTPTSLHVPVQTATFFALPYSDTPGAFNRAPFLGAVSRQAPQECPRGEISTPAPVPINNFYFTRGQYSGRGGAWRTDFNKADRQFLVVLNRILELDAFPCENPVALDDPALRNFPFLYILEVGGMGLTGPQAEGLRSYLLSGGFLLIDDFWGTNDWDNLARHMSAIFPEYQIVDIPMDHLIFRIVYPIEKVLQVPCECRTAGGPSFYYESDGYEAHLRGIFDANGRLMVAIAWNSDLGDAWEWAEQSYYPWDRSNYAFQLAFNLITYAMTN